MNLQRIELTVLDYNECAKHLYEKSGFQFEGRKRKSIYKNGRFVDMLMYSVLKDEFLEMWGGVTIRFSVLRCHSISMVKAA